MNTKKNIAIAVLAAVILSPLSVQAGKTEDAKITSEVRALLAKTKDLPEKQIEVMTQDNVVQLSGFVDTTLQVNKAVELAYSISEVKDVDAAMLETKSSDSLIKDSLTTAKVKGRILQLSNNKKISPNYDLHVETVNGQVHVHGRVASKKDIQTIESALQDMKSIKQVKTSITV